MAIGRSSNIARRSRTVPAPTRRGFLRAGTASLAGLCLTCKGGFASAVEPVANERFIGLVPFADEEVAPSGQLIGSELDGRLFTDLSRFTARRLTTPAAEFFVRSAASRLLPDPAGWNVVLDGLVEGPTKLPIASVRKAASPRGVHLLECAGNVALTRFGLISVAGWTGVSITEILAEAKPKPGTAWVEISGFDEYSAPSRTSVPGASWIFPVEALKGAFLATAMNDLPLTPNHGAPVRLIIPGWYGAACIKWVNRITFVQENAEATSQMKEYAIRTLQPGKPSLARDYAPAVVDPAALPVRVEKWAVAGKLRYRIAGLAWGGTQPIKALQIRFNPREPFVSVPAFHQGKSDPWTLWTCPWSPASPGDYQIRMAIADPLIQARKLELGLYDRTVHISEV